ncbi:MAG: type VI secretion system protein TssA [Desulfovibrio sp.]|nr:type VI secretion system protein TssA [Desulfovibrio sp.]
MAEELVAEICRPLSGEFPAGEDSRYEPEYTELTDMIERLSSVTQEGFDWRVVRDRAAAVLRHKSKDFQAATYLAIALLHTDGLQGALDGVRILQGLVEGFWETGFPVLKRIRGRINAFTWWKDRLLAYLESYPADQPASFAAGSALPGALESLDSALGAVLPDFPPLRDLIQAARRLPVEAAPAPEPQAKPEAESASAPEAAADPKPEPAPAPAPAAKTAPTPVPQPAAPPPAPQRTSAPAPQPQALSDDAQANRRAMLRSVADFAEWGRANAPSDQIFWQASCFACWSGLAQLPPSEGGATLAPAPDPDPADAVAAHLQAGSLLDAASLAMDSLLASPLSLDLAFLAHECLKGLGADFAPCALAVEGACATLLRRLPGIERLAFSSGRPFAGAKAQAWFASLAQESASSAKAVSGHDPAVAEAETLAAKGSLAKALDLLDEARAKASSMEGKCAIRIAQARLLARAEQWNAAQALAEELSATFAEGSPLATWHPRLACDALKTAAGIWEGIGGEAGLARAAETLRRLASVKPSAALRSLLGA